MCIGLISCNTNSSAAIEADEGENLDTEIKFDARLAEEYGADEYGMKLYVMAFLKRGPNRTKDEEKAKELQSAHLANINKLAEEGKLVLAGPFGGDGDIRGIYVFDTSDIEEATSWTATDPAIQAGSLEMDLVQWYGSAALMAINDLHDKVAKTPI
jgi:uncharacterized protein YciI